MRGPLRVLVVDDERAFAEVVAGYLPRESSEGALAHDGPSAVAAACRDKPEFVVLDVMLPGCDGAEVCRQFRAFSDAYVIMLTACDGELDKLVGVAAAQTTTSGGRSRRASSSPGSRATNDRPGASCT
jgi:DNA-binding response OmpR family regulator